MFNKSIITVAVLGAATFSANSASIEEVRVIATTAQNNAAHALIQNSTQDKNIAANKDAIAANTETIAKNYTEMKGSSSKALFNFAPENFCLLHKLNFCANDCSGYF